MSTDTQHQIDISNRLLQLYSGALTDIMDEMGYRNQALPNDIRPLDPKVKVAGPAFTVRGRIRTSEPVEDPRFKQMEMLEAIRPPAVVLVDSGDDIVAAHWGELMSTIARQNGATGAIIAGGLRDSQLILDMGFPIFRRFHSPLTAVWRFEQLDYQVPVKLGSVLIRPGDYLFGDIDGCIVLPYEIVLAVLDKAEEVVKKERIVFAELKKGANMRDLFAKYEVF